MNEHAAAEWNDLRARAEAVLATGDPQELFAFRHQLMRAARESNLPLDTPCDDPHVFLEEPRKLATATWAQCGGVLRALLKRGASLQSGPLLAVIARIAQLLPSHR